MAYRQTLIAIVYDFDGTLAKGNMQETSFIPKIGMTPREFWKESNKLAKDNEADDVLTYMSLMLKKARAADISIRKDDFTEHGRSIILFNGVRSWFDRINTYGREKKIKIEHYIISSGIQEMINGTLIASNFRKIYASSFKYDASGVAEWPALAINFTTKTQYLFRINKGDLAVCDSKIINKVIKMEDRPIPFENIIYIGDGQNDIPCFGLVKSMGGHSIAVYKPRTGGAKETARKFLTDRRVNFIAPADYSGGRGVEKIIMAILSKISVDSELRHL